MRGLFRRLCRVFEVYVCIDGSYLSIWRCNHVVVDAFSQRIVTCRTNLSIKGTWRHKYHQRGVRAQLQSPSPFLPITSRTRATFLEHSSNGPIESLRSYNHIHVLGYSVDVNLVCGLFLGGNVYLFKTLARSNPTGLISFHRTVNNFLMTGPKVITMRST